MNHTPLPHPLQAANLIAGEQNYPKSCLYLVPTPIGNLADITLRSLHVLSIVDSIACEDTRHAQHLLNQYGIGKKTLFSLHQHNEQEATAQLLQYLEQGQRVALITDAGTPAISDPGARAVHTVQKTNFRIMPLPGASSLTTAMSAAGLTHGSTLFHGFLSNKSQERQLTLQELLATPYAIVLLEAPHRIKVLMTELATQAPHRTVTIARELSKQFEQIVTLTGTELVVWLESKAEHSKGEFVCIVHAPVADQNKNTCMYDAVLQEALTYMPTKIAAHMIANLTGESKNKLYQRALEL
ncbi:MAG: 16S rRNA (cytidine(1402)-2'-O)-methyltransferase, partial [Saezia sp.]